MEETGFITEVKLAISFPRALAKRFIDQGDYWNIAVFRDGKDFSASSTSTQLGFLLAGTILKLFDVPLSILLKDRRVRVNFIRHLEYWSRIAI